MVYNEIEIGKRIKKERKELRYSQDDLAAWITTHCYRSCNRTTLWKWEHGKDLPPLETMLKLCELFRCDLGHLLGEYDQKTRPEVDIAKETGLSPQAVDKIMNTHNLYMINGLDRLLSNDNFIELLKDIGLYLQYNEDYQDERQKALTDGETRETESMHYLRLDCMILEYNIDTQFRNVLKDLSKSPSPEQAD